MLGTEDFTKSSHIRTFESTLEKHIDALKDLSSAIGLYFDRTLKAFIGEKFPSAYNEFSSNGRQLSQLFSSLAATFDPTFDAIKTLKEKQAIVTKTFQLYKGAMEAVGVRMTAENLEVETQYINAFVKFLDEYNTFSNSFAICFSVLYMTAMNQCVNDFEHFNKAMDCIVPDSIPVTREEEKLDEFISKLEE